MRDPEFVTSLDGTTLRVVRVGTGPPVVLVHGTAGGKGDWFEVAHRLSARFEVISFDRRGRGGSDDGEDYSIEREVEDVLAVVEASGPPVHLIGHSFGAIVSVLAAARAGDQVRTLALYEPPLGVQQADDAWLDQLEAIVDSGDLDTAIRRFAMAANITDDELRAMEGNETAWASLRDGVRVAGREIRAAKSVLPFRHADLQRITVPTLVLLGSEQTHPSYAGVRELAEKLPSGGLRGVPGRHLAIAFAPDAFAAALERFLASSG